MQKMAEACGFVFFLLLMTETKERSKTAASGRIICSCWSGLVFQNRVSEDIFVDYSFVQRDIHRVPCGHRVIVVINLHKILELWPLSNVLVHGSCHFSGIAVYSNHQRAWLLGRLQCHHQRSSWWLLYVRVTSDQDQHTFPAFINLLTLTAATWTSSRKGQRQFFWWHHGIIAQTLNCFY